MIRSFKDSETRQVYNGFFSKKLPSDIQSVARRKLRMVDAARAITDLRIPPGNRLEQLHGDLEGYWSIRINDQYRVIFMYEDGGADNVQITDYH